MDLTRIKSRSGAPFTVGGAYAQRFQGLLYDLEDAGYAIHANQSGGYNPRNIRGTNTPSQHSFGRAIDINWTDNPRGAQGKIPADLARDLAKKHGLTWGGDWKHPDPMHFEALRDGPVPMAERGLTSFAGLGGPKQPEAELPPMLAGFSNLPSAQYLAKRKTPGEPDLPPVITGSLPEPAGQAAPAQAGGLWDAIMNPMTIAGLSILGSPTRDVGQGLQVGMNAQEQLLRRLDPNRELERRYKEAQIAKMQREATDARSGIYGTPIYGHDPETGQMVLGAMGKDGTFKRIDTGGVEMSPGVQRVDLGDRIGVLDRSGNLIGNLPKNIAEAERQKKLGQYEGEAPQREAGKERLDTILSGLASRYVDLNSKGAIVSTERGAMDNLKARFGASEVGQAFSGAVGAEEQSIRQSINNSRPLLLQSIMQATGMSARALDSNKELEFYLQAVSDPKRDLTSNLAAIDAIDKTYGLGNVLQRTLPPELYAKVAAEADRQLASRPIQGQPSTSPPQGQPRVRTYNPQTGGLD